MTAPGKVRRANAARRNASRSRPPAALESLRPGEEREKAGQALARTGLFPRVPRRRSRRVAHLIKITGSLVANAGCVVVAGT